MFSLGTGWMRILNFFLMGAVVIGLLVAGYKFWSNHYVDVGRNQVTAEVQNQNDALDNRVESVNTNIIHDVTHETQIIEKHTKDVEYVVRNSPTEPIANVTRERIDLVYNQQQSVREASQNAE